jgi:hypothetical protein
MARQPIWISARSIDDGRGEAGESNDGSHGLPERSTAFLVRLIRSYVYNRWIAYTGRNGEERKPVECGVPQGLVLGPILWITTYDSVLRCPMSPGTDMVCYADDTLVLAGGRGWCETQRLA